MPQEEQTPQKGPQASDTGEVEDMFADTDTGVPKPESPTGEQGGPSGGQAPSGDDMPSSGGVPTVGGGGIPWKPILIILGVLIVVIGAAAISFYLLSSRDSVAPEPPEEMEQAAPAEDTMEPEEEPQEVPEEDPEEEPESEEGSEEEPEEEPEEEEAPPADQDKDGLPDVREAELGTSATNPDTDGDGLFDREEVEVYNTDPQNPDTDGDGYQDGEEVDSGYNPDGPGELREIPE